MKSYESEIAPKENVKFIHFSPDRTDAAALAWAKKEKFPWAHILPAKHASQGLQRYAKNDVPYYVLIGRVGKVLAEGARAVFSKMKTLYASLINSKTNDASLRLYPTHLNLD